jgi:hypothetical protein
MTVRCRAGAVASSAFATGPGSAQQREERCSASGTRGSGYRFAKRQGKPNFANPALTQQNRRFRGFAIKPVENSFRFDSSRTLNCSSNLIGHDDPNKPANGGGE